MQVFELAENLIKTHGSPCFVLSLNEVEKNVRALSQVLPGVKFYYAVKANPHQKILDKLNHLGCYFDVSTNKELEQVLELDIPVEKSIHTHPVKSKEEIEFALEKGLNFFTVDNKEELLKFTNYKDSVKLSIRLSISNDDCRINLSEKFGCSAEEALELMRLAAEQGINITCLSFHVGSQCTNPDRYIDALELCREIELKAKTFGTVIKTVDIGGGFPVQYTGEPVEILSYCKKIDEYLSTYMSHLEIIAEPGRFLVASSMTLLTTVKGKSVRNGHPWYFIDDSIYQSFSGIVFDKCDFPLMHPARGDLQKSMIAGSTCDSCDVIKRDIELPDLNIGQVLIFKQMGAYCSASASFFNGYSPTQIVVDESLS